MSIPSPLQSFLGGLGLPFSVHALTLLNGSVFGISGFLHRAARGNKEAIAGVAGLLFGGIIVGFTEGAGPHAVFPMSYLRLILSGLLVGVGTKVGNGCTSGHMLCGISRLSVRSITATAVFFSTGAIAARFAPESVQAPSRPFDWSLGPTGTKLLALQAIPLTVSVLLYILAPRQTNKSQPALPIPRLIALFATSIEFALALRLSSLTEPIKIFTFLFLPFNAAFDPSLAFLAVGALPLTTLLYHFARGPEQPRLGGTWSVPKGGKVDLRLIIGAALFGIGWGSGGICPGPALVNLGRAISGGSDPLPMLAWLSAMLLGGVVAEL